MVSHASKVIDSYSTLEKRIRTLPPVKKGFRRVFRGQWRHYEKILPKVHRGGAFPRATWYPYAMMLSKALTKRSDSANDWRHLYDSERLARIVANDAVLQHYGAGSEYLDATHSLAVALWFALHKPSTFQLPSEVVGAGDERFVFDATVTSYSKNPEPGVLYVFDVKEWTGGERVHGLLFDISQVSTGGILSARAYRQSGCLIFADARGDLTDQLITSPISVAWPMRGAPADAFVPAEKLFPPPSQDEIYRAILDVPLVPDLSVQSSSRGIRTVHPLGMDIYDCASINEIVERLGVLEYPCVLPDLKARIESASHDQPSMKLTSSHPLLKALPILFEAPIAAIRAEAAWNTHLLLESLAERTRARTATRSSSIHDLDLRNVFVEFSPLEFDRWFEFEDPSKDFLLLRAIWFFRDSGRRIVMAFADSYSAGKGRALKQYGPYMIDMSANGSLVLTPISSVQPGNNDVAILKRGLFPVLTLLRDLEPSEKEYSYKTRIVSGPKMTTFTTRQTQLAELVQTVVKYRGAHYYLPKELGTDEPYTGLL